GCRDVLGLEFLDFPNQFVNHIDVEPLRQLLDEPFVDLLRALLVLEPVYEAVDQLRGADLFLLLDLLRRLDSRRLRHVSRKRPLMSRLPPDSLLRPRLFLFAARLRPRRTGLLQRRRAATLAERNVKSVHGLVSPVCNETRLVPREISVACAV